MDYTRTHLWQSAFISDSSDNSQRDNLKKAYEKARDNASIILNQIRQDFPQLTIHDITHADSLWQVADVIVGKNYLINPLEGFILGCTFLLHDAALSYDSVGGIDALRGTLEWKDYFAEYCDRNDLPEDEKIKETDFKTIRLLHSRKAEKLYEQLFARNDGSTFYVIEDESLRRHYGKLICKIAASHHWNYDILEAELGTQQPPDSQFPSDWEINPIKLACILRCADAGHIDSGRAPDYLINLLAINDVSQSHWVAQNKLCQIATDRTDKEKVIIASNIDFEESDFASWNVAYDAVCVLNRELKSSFELLKRINPAIVFQAKGVSGAESRKALSQYIKANGWQPIDAPIHISNVEDIILKLGGQKLYGPDNSIEIVIRELIQNARDAIVARQNQDKGFNNGRINLIISQEDGCTWITIQDNGVGMSQRTVENYLLNFGASFWASDLAKSEFPGLRSSDFKSIGQFGIGFFSVFMIASKVYINTRKYDSAYSSTIQVKFPTGLCLRPIIKNGICSSNISTEVKVCIDSTKCSWSENVIVRSGQTGVNDLTIPFSAKMSWLVAGLDVDVYYQEMGNSLLKIHTDITSPSFDTCNWLEDISFAKYQNDRKVTEYIHKNYQRLERIYDGNRLVGLAALNTLYSNHPTYLCVTTVGGLSSFINNNGMNHYIGFISTTAKTAKRDANDTKTLLLGFIQQQYIKLKDVGLIFHDRLYLPYIVSNYNVNMMKEIVIVILNKKQEIKYYTLDSLISDMLNKNYSLIFPVDSYIKNRCTTYIDYERTREKLNDDDLLFRPINNSNFLNLLEDDNECPYNIYNCIKGTASEMGLIIESHYISDKAYCIIDGNTAALAIRVRVSDKEKQ